MRPADSGNQKLRVGIVVPTLNAGEHWPAWIEAMRAQSLQPEEVVVVDSSSDDSTVDLAVSAGYQVISIERQSFDHGGSRQLAVDRLYKLVDVVVLLTQDAELADPHSLHHLLQVFDDITVGCAYGRQLARSSHSAIARHHRAFNYPEVPSVSSAESLGLEGLQAAFCSNSFAAYRMEALIEAGGFPSGTIFGEDMLTAVKIMRLGYLKCYVPTALVWHAHDYSVSQELRRYFDMGVMHTTEPLLAEIVKSIGTSKGQAFVRSEIATVAGANPLMILALVLRSGCRWVGYQLGKRHQWIPLPCVNWLAMNKSFFTRKG